MPEAQQGSEGLVLVTGAQGFLGRHLVAALLRDGAGARVVGVGRSERLTLTFSHRLSWRGGEIRAPLPAALVKMESDPRYDYQTGDLADLQQTRDLIDELHPAVIFHSAAALRDEPWKKLLESNTLSTRNLVEAVAGQRPAPRVVYISSGSVYGMVDAHGLPISEGADCRPVDPYGFSKLLAERCALAVAANREVPVVIARVFNLLGPGLQERHLPARLATQVAAVVTGLGPPVIRTGPLDTTRDFIDVRDAAEAIIVLAGGGEPGTVYNVATGRETPVAAILDGLLAVAGLDDVERETLPRREPEIRRSYAQVGRLRALGFEPRFALDASLADMLAYCTELAELPAP